MFDFFFEKERKWDKEENERRRDRERRLRATNPKSLFWDFVGLEPSSTWSPRRRESRMVRWCIRQRVWLSSARLFGTAWFKSDKISRKEKVIGTSKSSAEVPRCSWDIWNNCIPNALSCRHGDPSRSRSGSKAGCWLSVECMRIDWYWRISDEEQKRKNEVNNLRLSPWTGKFPLSVSWPWLLEAGPSRVRFLRSFSERKTKPDIRWGLKVFWKESQHGKPK